MTKVLEGIWIVTRLIHSYIQGWSIILVLYFLQRTCSNDTHSLTSIYKIVQLIIFQLLPWMHSGDPPDYPFIDSILNHATLKLNCISKNFL